MYTQSEFFYQLSNDLEYEMIDTNDSYLKSIFKGAEQYYAFPNISGNIEIKKQLILGNFAFYLLDFPNLDFDNATISKIQLINFFLSQCINDSKYCNNKIFLAFTRDILKMSRFPQNDIFASNYYNKSDTTNNLKSNERLDLIFNNVQNIKINKSYICNGIIDLIVASIFEIFSKGYFIKRCKNCHKYFFNKNSNKYCSYASPQEPNKSCYDYCANVSYVQKRDNDPIKKKYNTISNMLRSRYNYHHRQSDYDILSDFSNDYRIKTENLNKGIISKEDVIEFLNSSEQTFKKQYKGGRKNGSSRNNKK